MIITLSLPTKALSPNARTHWRTLAAAKKNYRAEAAWMAKIEISKWRDCKGAYPAKEVSITPIFFWPDRRKRDRLNAPHMLKAAFDGLQDGGVIVDDIGVDMQPVQFDWDKDFPRVELHITKIS